MRFQPDGSPFLLLNQTGTAADWTLSVGTGYTLRIGLARGRLRTTCLHLVYSLESSHPGQKKRYAKTRHPNDNDSMHDRHTQITRCHPVANRATSFAYQIRGFQRNGLPSA